MLTGRKGVSRGLALIVLLALSVCANRLDGQDHPLPS